MLSRNKITNFLSKEKKQETQTIPIRDLKEYLVKDFQKIKEDETIISNLKDRIDELEKIEIQYNATLITLEEFDSRIDREKEKVIKLEDKILENKEKIKKIEEVKNNHIIKEKQALDKLNNARETIISEYQDKLIDYINSRKGTLSKKKICEIIKQKI
mgnify:CR=1 FL=1